MRGLAQRRRDHIGDSETVQCRIGQIIERAMVGGQIITRPSLREDEAERGAIGFGFHTQGIRIAFRQVKRGDGVVKIDAEPCPQPVADAVDLAESRPLR